MVDSDTPIFADGHENLQFNLAGAFGRRLVSCHVSDLGCRQEQERHCGLGTSSGCRIPAVAGCPKNDGFEGYWVNRPDGRTGQGEGMLAAYRSGHGFSRCRRATGSDGIRRSTAAGSGLGVDVPGDSIRADGFLCHAPGPNGYCRASYEAVTYWAMACDDVAKSAFPTFKRSTPLRQYLLVLDGGPSAKVFMMSLPANRGCVTIKKEVLFQ